MRKKFLDDLRPYLKQKQKQAEKKKAMAKRDVLLDKFDKHNTLLSELEDDNELVKEDSFELLGDEIQVFDKPLVVLQLGVNFAPMNGLSFHWRKRKYTNKELEVLIKVSSHSQTQNSKSRR